MPPSWTLDKAADLRRGCYYTFYTPSSAVLEQVQPGDLVRLRFVFSSDDPEAPQAERMWVEVASRSGNDFTGHLTNIPGYIADLELGDLVSFEAAHIINTQYHDPEDVVEQYLDWCMVSNQVLLDQHRIEYFYREESLGEKSGRIDTGWRILSGLETADYLDDAANSQFVTLGTVLNIDDAIVDFLAEPVGSAFEWNDDSQSFVKVADHSND